MRRALHLAATYTRLGVMNEVQYRANFFVQLVQSLLSLTTSLVVLSLIYERTDDLEGWTRPQLLAVMGVFTMMGGLIATMIEPNMTRLGADVHLGTLDHVLTKPADAQLMVSVREFRLWQLVDVVVGAAVVGVAIVQLEDRVGAADAAAFAIALVIGGVLVYSFWLMITTGAFWIVRMDHVQELFMGLYRAGRFPVTVYPSWLRYGLTFLVPVAFAVTVPSEAITGRLDATSLALAALFAAALLGVARAFWHFGLRHYGGASA